MEFFPPDNPDNEKLKELLLKVREEALYMKYSHFLDKIYYSKNDIRGLDLQRFVKSTKILSASLVISIFLIIPFINYLPALILIFASNISAIYSTYRDYKKIKDILEHYEPPKQYKWKFFRRYFNLEFFFAKSRLHYSELENPQNFKILQKHFEEHDQEFNFQVFMNQAHPDLDVPTRIFETVEFIQFLNSHFSEDEARQLVKEHVEAVNPKLITKHKTFHELLETQKEAEKERDTSSQTLNFFQKHNDEVQQSKRQ